MMDQQDLQKIDEILLNRFESIWQDNLKPAFDNIDSQFEKVNTRLADMDGQIANLPDKDWATDRFADLKGDLIVKLRKEDEKLNRLVEILKEKSVIDDKDVKRLAELQVFPKFEPYS